MHKRFPLARTDGFPSAGLAVLPHKNIHLIETAQSEMKLEKLFRIAEVLDVTPNKLLPGEAKTASNKFFEFEHMMKQLSEADQELIFNMVMPCMKRLLPNT